MGVHNCQKGTNIGEAYKGKCQPLIPDIPRPTFRPGGCPLCLAAISAPVCGTDGKNYDECMLRKFNCERGTNIGVAHRGQCKPPPVACPIGCPRHYAPICGTDGKTYSNECVLRSHNCKMGTNIGVAYEGKCKAPPMACSIACTRDYRPICGTDGKTYSNGCMLRFLNCERGTNIGVAHGGECKPMIIPGMPRPCPKCSADHTKPVCGTDGNTYRSKCYLDTSNCNKMTNIVGVAHEGECKPMISEEDLSQVFTWS